MNKNSYDSFYQKNSEKFGRYKKQEINSKLVGKELDFFSLIKKYAHKKHRVLDLGCGSGELTSSLAPLFREIVGLDFMPAYIETANRENKNPNVSFLVGDAKNMPFENESFDLIISSRGPLSADESFMKEASRVLRLGGLMIEETIGEKDRLALKEIFGRG